MEAQRASQALQGRNTIVHVLLPPALCWVRLIGKPSHIVEGCKDRLVKRLVLHPEFPGCLAGGELIQVDGQETLQLKRFLKYAVLDCHPEQVQHWVENWGIS